PLYTIFVFHPRPPTLIYPLSLHDALPISHRPTSRETQFHPPRFLRRSEMPGRSVSIRERNSDRRRRRLGLSFHRSGSAPALPHRSEEHTSELQSPCNLVCRLLLEKKKKHK